MATTWTCMRMAIGLIAFGSVASSSIPAHAEAYDLQSGDVLSITFIGPADLVQAIPIEMDGSAWFPIIGKVDAAGSTLSEVRTHAMDRYSVTSFPVASGDQTVPQLILPSQVHITMESYRPIRLSGALPQPQSIEFRPGLSVWDAITLAGLGPGLEITPARLRALRLDRAASQARIWRLKSLLGIVTDADWAVIFADPGADETGLEAVAEIEAALLSAQTAELEREEQRLSDAIDRVELRLAALEKQRASEVEGLELDEALVSDLRKLAADGLAVTARLLEVRRAAVTSASNVLELDVAIEEVRSELETLRGEYSTVRERNRSAVWAELSEAMADIRDQQADLAVFELTTAGMASAGSPLMAMINRGGEMLHPVELGVEDRLLHPGDRVEIVAAARDPSRF